MNKTELYDKYKRFVRKRLMESDPLVRWCTKPGCGMNMKAENMDATKLTCPECSTEVCFKCRDTWHGENKTCQDALRDRFEGWVSENKGNCSFCPCCRTKIEKTTGCNQMACSFCKYQFCWACGAQSVNYSHFRMGAGCGVGLMD